MEFEMKSRVYIKVDEQGRIVRCEGEYTLPSDLTDWILIEEGSPCDRLNLAQSHYFDGGLYTMDGIPRYRWDGSAAVLRTDKELEAELRSIQWKAEVESKVRVLKQKLSDTDYQAIKFSEGWFTEGEFAPMKAYRQSLRDKINELENGGNPYTFSFGPGLTPTIVHSEEEVSE